jgi:hypothetical protein
MNIDRKHGLVWGSLAILLGLMSLLENFFSLGPYVWAAALAFSGLGVYGLYAADRSEKWLLIVSYVLLVVGIMVAMINLGLIRDEGIATYVLWAIGLPFLWAFLRNRIQWYFLVPAYVLFVVGLMVGLIGLRVIDDFLIPAYVMLAISAPFFVVYARDRKNWWALIPGGIMGFMGLAFMLADDSVRFVVPVVLIVVGVWVLVRQFTKKEA